MPDSVFADPRLARIYDPLDRDRSDLDAYVAMVQEFGAAEVLDVGCGTGTLACLLAKRGVRVVAVDPADASLEVARAKPGAEKVRWVHGDVTALPPLQVDMATMTGNVAQVFLDDKAFCFTLRRIRGAVRDGGRVVFEVRDPRRQAWLSWNRDATYRRTDIAGVGVVASWTDLTAVELPLVSFRQFFHFEDTGAVLTSDSTLCFRSTDEVRSSVERSGLRVLDVRDAPDRPGLEHVFVCAPHG